VDAAAPPVRPATRPTGLDAGVVAVLAAWAMVEAVALDGPGGTAERLAAALAYTLPLLARRRLPLLPLLVVLAVVALRGIVHDTPEEGAMPVPVILVGAFSAGAHARTTALAVLGAALGVATLPVLLAVDYFKGASEPSDWAIIPFLVLGAWGAGRVAHHRAQQARAAEERGPEIARAAVADERARIARELHDVVAHSISVIGLQAGAAEGLVEQDPARAREHLEAVRRTSQETLREMRRLLDVLREDDADLAPQPGLERLDELVADAGVPVTVEVRGDRDGLAPGVDLAAFRIVQEALTNVRKHAGPVPTTVRVDYRPGEVALEVVNAPGRTPAAGPGGAGLPGMRERVRLYGGRMDAAAEPDGGFAVRATLPRGPGA
jgi:signal transduction histidine kinase